MLYTYYVWVPQSQLYYSICILIPLNKLLGILKLIGTNDKSTYVCYTDY